MKLESFCLDPDVLASKTHFHLNQTSQQTDKSESLTIENKTPFQTHLEVHVPLEPLGVLFVLGVPWLQLGLYLLETPSPPLIRPSLSGLQGAAFNTTTNTSISEQVSVRCTISEHLSEILRCVSAVIGRFAAHCVMSLVLPVFPGGPGGPCWPFSPGGPSSPFKPETHTEVRVHRGSSVSNLLSKKKHGDHLQTF